MKLRNSLEPLDLSEEDISSVLHWYDSLRINEVVFPQALAVDGHLGIRLSERILTLLALRKMVRPVTMPKVDKKVLKSYATEGYEVVITEDIEEEARSKGVNPREIKAVTGFKKCSVR